MAESRQWAPSRWSPDKRWRFCNRVLFWRDTQVCSFLGMHAGCLLLAELYRDESEEVSRMLLQQANIATMGQREETPT